MADDRFVPLVRPVRLPAHERRRRSAAPPATPGRMAASPAVQSARRQADSEFSGVVSLPYLFLQAWPGNADALVVDLHGRGRERFLAPPRRHRGALDLDFGGESISLLEDGTLRKYVERAGVLSLTPAGLLTLGLGPGPLTGHGEEISVEALAEYLLAFAEFAVATDTRPRVNLWEFQLHLVPAGHTLADANGPLIASDGNAARPVDFSSGIVMGGNASPVAFALLAWLWAHCGLPERSIPFRHEGSDALGFVPSAQPVDVLAVCSPNRLGLIQVIASLRGTASRPAASMRAEGSGTAMRVRGQVCGRCG